MTVPSVVGSIVEINSNDSSGSQSVTVPSGAALCLLFAGYWANADGRDLTSASLGGAGFTKVDGYTGTSYQQSTAWYVSNPASGLQTFSWLWNGSLSDGAVIALVFLQDVDTSSPIRGSGNSAGYTLATTSAFSTDENDLCICGVSSYGSVDAGVGSGQTEIFDSDSFSGQYLAIGTKAGTAGTATMSGAGTSPSAVAMSVKGSVAAATAEQEGFRWRADDGDEVSATWLDAQDTDVSLNAGAHARLRVLIDTESDYANTQFQLEYRETGSGQNWRKVE